MAAQRRRLGQPDAVLPGPGLSRRRPDRRGHGRSAQVSEGHDMDHYAADASAVAEHLDLRNAIHIGHSTGGGQGARYVAQFGQPQAGWPRRVWMPPVWQAKSSVCWRVFDRTCVRPLSVAFHDATGRYAVQEGWVHIGSESCKRSSPGSECPCLELRSPCRLLLVDRSPRPFGHAVPLPFPGSGHAIL